MVHHCAPAQPPSPALRFGSTPGASCARGVGNAQPSCRHALREAPDKQGGRARRPLPAVGVASCSAGAPAPDGGLTAVSVSGRPGLRWRHG